ncbi:flagellar basal-body rod protein FlgF [Thioalkalivibrio sp. ALE21]|uniref:flagellar basal-body rod protein FlgF n=1 Tax=Thioalkalivibrio sp. ALE21 TaxID=1158175 RepID=UPI000D9C4352|nr:flagellar basal-body rod protein FlgF [Thioalkalivibrio sp. ALE21]PYG00811.1 flagellar basal-body rod protein FlgF [Thioalkalivibrio sp. ALE21]
MDRFLYIAMSGARETEHAQSVNNHNLANANTDGFRQALATADTVPVRGPVYDTRDYVQVGTEAADFSKGTLRSTGRDLDVAINGDGFIAVQGPDGQEGYTRAGNLQVDGFGLLRTADGMQVMGDGGPIAIPPSEKVEIGTDGTISVRPQGAPADALAAVERIRLVNPDVEDLERGDDGLFRMADGGEAPADADVTLTSGALESSNVNTVEALTRMIELSRTYETQVKMMDTANTLEQSSNRLLGMG